MYHEGCTSLVYCKGVVGICDVMVWHSIDWFIIARALGLNSIRSRSTESSQLGKALVEFMEPIDWEATASWNTLSLVEYRGERQLVGSWAIKRQIVWNFNILFFISLIRPEDCSNRRESYPWQHFGELSSIILNALGMFSSQSRKRENNLSVLGRSIQTTSRS